MENKFAYDVTLDGNIVGDSGDSEFDTEVNAIVDANNLIDKLLEEYPNRKFGEFKVDVYEIEG